MSKMCDCVILKITPHIEVLTDLMMKSLESMRPPYWDPLRFPEFPTTAQVLQRSGLASK